MIRAALLLLLPFAAVAVEPIATFPDSCAEIRAYDKKPNDKSYAAICVEDEGSDSGLALKLEKDTHDGVMPLTVEECAEAKAQGLRKGEYSVCYKNHAGVGNDMVAICLNEETCEPFGPKREGYRYDQWWIEYDIYFSQHWLSWISSNTPFCGAVNQKHGAVASVFCGLNMLEDGETVKRPGTCGKDAKGRGANQTTVGEVVFNHEFGTGGYHNVYIRRPAALGKSVANVSNQTTLGKTPCGPSDYAFFSGGPFQPPAEPAEDACGAFVGEYGMTYSRRNKLGNRFPGGFTDAAKWPDLASAGPFYKPGWNSVRASFRWPEDEAGTGSLFRLWIKGDNGEFYLVQELTNFPMSATHGTCHEAEADNAGDCHDQGGMWMGQHHSAFLAFTFGTDGHSGIYTCDGKLRESPRPPMHIMYRNFRAYRDDPWAGLVCDFDGNKAVDVQDMFAMKRAIQADWGSVRSLKDDLKPFDLDGDGRVNFTDMSIFQTDPDCAI